MILVLDENNELQLTEKAQMIDIFANLYSSYGTDTELAMSAFSVMYFMYNFDSDYLRRYSDERKRLVAVRKFVRRGSDIKITWILRKAMDLYKEIYTEDSGSMYLIMYENVQKLKHYASIMVLISPLIGMKADTDEEKENLPVSGVDYILVESKEFVTINSMLPQQQRELDAFEIKLMQIIKNKIDIFGGGKLGAYE